MSLIESRCSMEWEKYRFIIGFMMAGSVRKKVMLALKNQPLIPSQLAKATEMRLAPVSRTLTGLENKGLVECLTPKLRGRVYILTE